MCRTRADFELALRQCKAAEEQFKADTKAIKLACKQNPRSFWNSVSRECSKKVYGYANKVGDAVGADNVCKMWESLSQFSSLYNSSD